MSSASTSKARLLYCKSHVSIHPTQFNKDNISGYLALVEADGLGGVTTDDEGNPGRDGKELIVSWVPDEVLQRMDETDRAGYKKVEERSSQNQSDPEDEDGEYRWRSHMCPRTDKKALFSFQYRHLRGRSMPFLYHFQASIVYWCTR